MNTQMKALKRSQGSKMLCGWDSFSFPPLSTEASILWIISCETFFPFPLKHRQVCWSIQSASCSCPSDRWLNQMTRCIPSCLPCIDGASFVICHLSYDVHGGVCALLRRVLFFFTACRARNASPRHDLKGLKGTLTETFTADCKILAEKTWDPRPFSLYALSRWEREGEIHLSVDDFRCQIIAIEEKKNNERPPLHLLGYQNPTLFFSYSSLVFNIYIGTLTLMWWWWWRPALPP